MQVLFVVAALAAGAAVAPARPAPTAQCSPASNRVAARGPAKPRKLGELPPAQEIKAVWRTDDRGCPFPLVVRSAIGAGH